MLSCDRMHFIECDEKVKELQIAFCQRLELVEIGRYAENWRAGTEYAVVLQTVDLAVL